MATANEHVRMPGPIQAFWIKSAWEGGCTHCHGKPENVAKIETADHILRFCRDCLESMRDIADSMLSE